VLSAGRDLFTLASDIQSDLNAAEESTLGLGSMAETQGWILSYLDEREDGADELASFGEIRDAFVEARAISSAVIAREENSKKLNARVRNALNALQLSESVVNNGRARYQLPRTETASTTSSASTDDDLVKHLPNSGELQRAITEILEETQTAHSTDQLRRLVKDKFPEVPAAAWALPNPSGQGKYYARLNSALYALSNKRSLKRNDRNDWELGGDEKDASPAEVHEALVRILERFFEQNKTERLSFDQLGDTVREELGRIDVSYTHLIQAAIKEVDHGLTIQNKTIVNSALGQPLRTNQEVLDLDRAVEECRKLVLDNSYRQFFDLDGAFSNSVASSYWSHQATTLKRSNVFTPGPLAALEVLNGRRFLVIGKPGSGKSAFYTQLVEPANRAALLASLNTSETEQSRLSAAQA
jgi:hypothetical protein